MYCRNCGKELDEDARFCPNCGAEQESFAQTETVYTTAAVVEDKPPRVWSVFSTIGKVLGIVCLATSLIPYINYFSFCFAIVGIVMSCLGRKAKTEEADKNCSLGLKLSIAATVISFVMMIMYPVIFIIVLGQAFV